MNQQSTPLPPGSTLGVFGGGQLGRMFAQAADKLGYRVHVFAPEADCPAAQVAAEQTVADY
ncbi:MAG: 5-(carboxyamino)imidazole ribonucleotide synthase, partial [Aeoliella sp.]